MYIIIIRYNRIDYYILPFSEIKRREWFLFKYYGGEFFIRPNSVNKTFGAKTLNEDNFDLEIKTLEEYEAVSDNELVVICSVKKLKFEFRFFIVNGKVVTGSQYQYNGILDIRNNIKPEALKLAKEIARLPRQPDVCYVVDIGITEYDECKVIELNALSCSGVYACDTRKIVKAVSKVAEKEFKGELL